MDVARADCPPTSSIACKSAFIGPLSTRVYCMSTDGVHGDQHLLYRCEMNLGKRIEQRLHELRKERSYLFDQVPELSPQRLSALISRDSKRCELDVQIARALKVRLEWLNDGELPKEIDESSVLIAGGQPNLADNLKQLPNKTRHQARVDEIVVFLNKTNMEGLAVILDKAVDMAAKYPLSKETLSSSQ